MALYRASSEILIFKHKRTGSDGSSSAGALGQGKGIQAKKGRVE
jgi:hypothetical protein